MQVIPASCPQCGTQYQLTPEHLAVANGKVRCGICNTIFQAAPAIPVAPVYVAPAASPAPPLQKSKFVNEDDDLLLKRSAGKKLDEEYIQDSPDDDKDDFLNVADDDNFGMSDEMSKIGKTGLEEEEIDDEEWISKLLSDEGLDAEEVIKKEDTRKEIAKEQPRQALGSSIDDFDFDFEGLDDSALSLSKDEEAALGFGDSTKNEMISKIKSEPLVFQIFSTRSLLSTIGLSIMGFVALCGVVTQLFLFQKDTLSRTPQWHAFYQGICNIAGCTLPEQYAIEDIQATNLTIKSHAHFRNSLMIDAIIVNHADIMQPFPDIELFFTDTAQNIVAARRFRPAEYLRGELADAQLMPNQQSIHIALEIDDPSQNATGYSIKLAY